MLSSAIGDRMQLLTQSLAAFVALLFATSGNAQAPPDFTGHWRIETDSGVQRQLDLEQKGNTLRVKTTVINSKGTRHLEVSYHIGGPETVYKGLDGDEFRSSVHWDATALVFDTVEHEDGRDLPETTTWTLSEDRNRLQVRRQTNKSGKTTDSLNTFVRRP
jgi:hypothetical protein